MSKNYIEDTRVKIPAILHSMKLGFECLSIKYAVYGLENNIITEIFKNAVNQINSRLSASDIDGWYKEIALSVENDDLGKVFFESLTMTTAKNTLA